MHQSSQDIRKSILAKWHESLSKYGNLLTSDNVSGSSPPSVFVGSYNYPKVFVGPMVPPIHGDTELLDNPEKWAGKSLEEIVNFRLNLVRGVQKISVDNVDGRYIENLQELSMSSKSIDSDLKFYRPIGHVSLDGESAPFGPMGEIKSIKFSNSSANKFIEKAFYDRDLGAQDAVISLYNSGIELSKIQKCFSMGMFGKTRKLVPTRWSITATDDTISKYLVDKVLEFDLIDSYRVFHYSHLGNIFSIVLFPHRWLYGMTEAWYSNGVLGFGSDSEDARGIDHPPAIAGAYYAAKLSIAEYLLKNSFQSGVIVLREIQPEYSIPVGVWQVREGIRSAMHQEYLVADSLDAALDLASKKMSISKNEWLSHGNLLELIQQKTMHDFF